MTKIFSIAHDDQHDVRYAHFRSNFINPLSTKLTPHNRVDHSFGGLTVAYNPVLINRKDGSYGVFLETGRALCHGRDRFVKQKGRDIALRSLLTRAHNLYDMIYVGEGVIGNRLEPFDVPLIANIQGDVFINESQFSIRAFLALVAGYNDYY